MGAADYKLRQTAARDAADLAMLDNIGSHGLSLWFWQGAVKMGKADDPLDWGRQRMADQDMPFAWPNAVVAELDDSVLGGITSYLMPQLVDEDKAADPIMAPMMDLFASAAGHWLVDNLAVFENARGRGVGAALLDHAFELARKAECRQISLVAADDNAPALALYRSREFAERDRRVAVPWSAHVKTKHWLLLTAPLN
ncbi:MAG: GNAT family N-acetyltransferase [Ahrensia sp.]|nr:GNAT family N-acetyltransferase [Ahrensia sp.]